MTEDQQLKLECTKATGSVQEAKVLYQWLLEERKEVSGSSSKTDSSGDGNG